MYEAKIAEVYGAGSIPILSVADVDRLIRLGDDGRFGRYLKILYLAKLILICYSACCARIGAARRSRIAREHDELLDMDWYGRDEIRDKLLNGEPLSDGEATLATKTRFHHAREVEHYQHDVLNRMIDKRLTLVSLPSSNKKLTGALSDYKDHPFSWWEKKRLRLGVGTDNDVTLNTNVIREMLILLLTDPLELKITKLLIATGESRRPHLSHLLWQMCKATENG